MNKAIVGQKITKGSSKTEFYNLSERILNSGDAYWGNLGFWKYANDYSIACEALAHQLALKVNLGEKSRVLDAGFGCGDQLLLWLEQYRIEFLCGVNYSVSQTQIAKQRLDDSENDNAKSELLIQGDVIDLLNSSSWDCSPLNHENVNTVLALDCAYHFSSRQQFLIDSFNVLSRSRGSGSIGLTDIVLADAPLSWGKRLILNSMLNVSRIPQENIVTLTEYNDQLRKAGFEKVESQDISEHVFEPFGYWFKSKAADCKFKGNIAAWLKYKVTATFLAWAYKQQVLKYIVVSARAL